MGTMHLDSRFLAVLALLALAPSLRADLVNALRSSVTGVRDVNADGIPDLAVASRDRNRAERVWVLSGKDGGRLLQVEGQHAGDRFGSEVVDLGDWDGDGSTDIAIEARSRRDQWAPWNRGYRRIVSTKSGATLLDLPFVGAISGASDVDGDGKLELLLSDASAKEVSISMISAPDGRSILEVPLRKREVDERGRGVEALAWIGDLDGDGRTDFAVVVSERVGRKEAPITQCQLELRSGRDGVMIWTRELISDSEGGLVTLHRIGSDPSNESHILVCVEDHFVKTLRVRDGELLVNHRAPRHVLYSYGSSLDVVGDMNRDGCEDWILGANESHQGFFDAGLCLVVSGKTSEVLHSLKEDEKFGYDACGIGDVNGDGVPDFALGAECQVGCADQPLLASTEDFEPYVQVRSGKEASILWTKRHVDLRK